MACHCNDIERKRLLLSTVVAQIPKTTIWPARGHDLDMTEPEPAPEPDTADPDIADPDIDYPDMADPDNTTHAGNTSTDMVSTWYNAKTVVTGIALAVGAVTATAAAVAAVVYFATAGTAMVFGGTGTITAGGAAAVAATTYVIRCLASVNQAHG